MERLLASRLGTSVIHPSSRQVNDAWEGKPAHAKPANATAGAVRSQTRPRLRSIAGGGVVSHKSKDINSLPDYFGDAEPQPPPVTPRDISHQPVARLT